MCVTLCRTVGVCRNVTLCIYYNVIIFTLYICFLHISVLHCWYFSVNVCALLRTSMYLLFIKVCMYIVRIYLHICMVAYALHRQYYTLAHAYICVVVLIFRTRTLQTFLRIVYWGFLSTSQWLLYLYQHLSMYQSLFSFSNSRRALLALSAMNWLRLRHLWWV